MKPDLNEFLGGVETWSLGVGELGEMVESIDPEDLMIGLPDCGECGGLVRSGVVGLGPRGRNVVLAAYCGECGHPGWLHPVVLENMAKNIR